MGRFLCPELFATLLFCSRCGFPALHHQLLSLGTFSLPRSYVNHLVGWYFPAETLISLHRSTRILSPLIEVFSNIASSHHTLASGTRVTGSNRNCHFDDFLTGKLQLQLSSAYSNDGRLAYHLLFTSPSHLAHHCPRLVLRYCLPQASFYTLFAIFP